MRRRVFCLGLVLVLVLALGLSGCKKKEEAKPLVMKDVIREINSKQVSDFQECGKASDYVRIRVVNFGDIVVRLRPDVAPIAVQNFKDLTQRGYYNGTVFHRVMPGFMIQGGDGADDVSQIKGEFSANGVDNPLRHVRGVISMARVGGLNDSATSQFFLMHRDYPSLNGQYAAFGYIVAGLETVDRICEIDLDTTSSGETSIPKVEVKIESVVFVEPAG